MTALINYTITERNFELIRNRIGEILFVELDNQFKRYNPFAAVDGVYIERKKPIDENETSFINVSVISGDFDNKNVRSKDGTIQYAIDVFTRMASKNGKPGYKESQLQTTRLLGICDYILENSQYKNLGFAPGSIGHTLVKQLQVADQNAQDVANIAMGRLTMTVRAIEQNALVSGVPLLTSVTQFNLEYTNQGYQYID